MSNRPEWVQPRFQLLEWRAFPADRPPKTTCLYSDGCATFWTGWYTSDDGVGIYVPLGDGSARLMAPEVFATVRWWANPGNFVAST